MSIGTQLFRLAGGCVIGLSMATVGCGNASDSGGEQTARGAEIDPGNTDFPLRSVDGSRLEVRYHGRLPFAERKDDEGFISHAIEDEANSKEDANVGRSFVVVNAQTGEAYDVTLPADMNLGMRGSDPSSFDPAPVENLTAKTWSDGVDTRTRRGNSDGFSDTTTIYRDIGAIIGQTGCTGSKVGRNIVLTAAHCVMRANNSNKTGFTQATDAAVYNWTFYPRLNNNTVSPTWGSQAAQWYWVPSGYVNGTCSGEGDCNKYDIAIALVGNNTTGNYDWMGTWAPGNASFTTAPIPSNWMRGYPSCSASGDSLNSRPGGATQMSQVCQTGTLYGDSNSCDIGAGRSVDPGTGRNREYLIGCDGSPGMSGSAIFTNAIDGQTGTRAVGVYSEYLCVGPACTTHWANRTTVVTPEVVGVIINAQAAGW